MISSTVSDFKDVRKALKDLLVETGYEVWVSEDGSIKTKPDRSAFENCFEAVKQADMLIFLIGGHYGALYDADASISVTRQEYRTALQSGKPHLVFVSSAVWEARAVYKAYLESGLPFVCSSQIKDERVIDFIDEVASQTTGNWIHVFNDISDLLRRVRTQLGIISPDYEFYYQPLKSSPTNSDGTLNFEIGFKNISAKPLLEFDIFLEFRSPVISMSYDFSRSAVNLTGGEGLSPDGLMFSWSGQMLPTDGWVVFVLKADKAPAIKRIVTPFHGVIVGTKNFIVGADRSAVRKLFPTR